MNDFNNPYRSTGSVTTSASRKIFPKKRNKFLEWMYSFSLAILVFPTSYYSFLLFVPHMKAGETRLAPDAIWITALIALFDLALFYRMAMLVTGSHSLDRYTNDGFGKLLRVLGIIFLSAGLLGTLGEFMYGVGSVVYQYFTMNGDTQGDIIFLLLGISASCIAAASFVPGIVLIEASRLFGYQQMRGTVRRG